MALISIAKIIFAEIPPMEAFTKLHDEYFPQSPVEVSAVTHTIINKQLWERDLKLIRSLSGNFGRLYPLYWKNELVTPKEKSEFERAQDSLKQLQRFVRDFNLVFMLQSAHLATFNQLWEGALHADTGVLGINSIE
jgi:hypothetical protein